MKKLPKEELLNADACLTAAKQIVEHKRKSGESPESIFIENGGFIFRKPSWEDAINLLFIRLKNQDTLLENEPIIVAESSEDL